MYIKSSILTTLIIAIFFSFQVAAFTRSSETAQWKFSSFRPGMTAKSVLKIIEQNPQYMKSQTASRAHPALSPAIDTIFLERMHHDKPVETWQLHFLPLPQNNILYALKKWDNLGGSVLHERLVKNLNTRYGSQYYQRCNNDNACTRLLLTDKNGRFILQPNRKMKDCYAGDIQWPLQKINSGCRVSLDLSWWLRDADLGQVEMLYIGYYDFALFEKFLQRQHAYYNNPQLIEQDKLRNKLKNNNIN